MIENLICVIVGALIAAGTNFITAGLNNKFQYKLIFHKEKVTAYSIFFDVANRYKDKEPSTYENTLTANYDALEAALDSGELTAFASKDIKSKIDGIGILLRSDTGRGTPDAELTRIRDIQSQLCNLIDLMRKELEV